MFHGLKRPVILAAILVVVSYQGQKAEAQSSPSQASSNAPSADIDLDSIEAEMSRRGEEQAIQGTPLQADGKEEDKKPVTFQELPKLSAFSDVAVIQRKYMPKSFRFQLYGGVDFLTNNPFFDTYGANLRLNFFFNEFVGVELNYWRHEVSSRRVTTDLQDRFSVTTKAMLSSKGFTGVSLLLVPFYGKMTFLDRRIIPYDLYVSAGVGTTETSFVDKAAPSLHLGTGEIFALSKNFAWRWEFSNVTYTAKVPEINNTGTAEDTGKKRTISDLYLGIGLTILFPGAKYR